MRAAAFLILLATSLSVAACAPSAPPPAESAAPAVMPSRIPAEQVVGSWGLASYHQEGARARTESMARAQCRQPYRIAKGPTGGVMMHLADEKEPAELRLKADTAGKNYIGPDGPITGADREIVSFDGKVMTTRWLDLDVAARYGTMIYVKCR